MSELERVKVLESQLKEILGPESEEILAILSDPEKLPILISDNFGSKGHDVDSTLEDLLSLVAKSSNSYVQLARFAGIAKAEYKLRKGDFERKYKQSRSGKNDAEREKNAMESCNDEHIAMTTMEAISDLAERLEDAARVASESSRKILDKASNMQQGENRESVGKYKDGDFTASTKGSW